MWHHWNQARFLIFSTTRGAVSSRGFMTRTIFFLDPSPPTHQTQNLFKMCQKPLKKKSQPGLVLDGLTYRGGQFQTTRPLSKTRHEGNHTPLGQKPLNRLPWELSSRQLLKDPGGVHWSSILPQARPPPRKGVHVPQMEKKNPSAFCAKAEMR